MFAISLLQLTREACIQLQSCINSCWSCLVTRVKCTVTKLNVWCFVCIFCHQNSPLASQIINSIYMNLLILWPRWKLTGNWSLFEVIRYSNSTMKWFNESATTNLLTECSSSLNTRSWVDGTWSWHCLVGVNARWNKNQSSKISIKCFLLCPTLMKTNGSNKHAESWNHQWSRYELRPDPELV